MQKTMILALALVALTACSDDDDTAGPGADVTRVLLTDAPFPFDLVQSVDIHIVSIEAATIFDTTATVAWTPLVTPDRRFNLLELQDGQTALLGEADVRATDYAGIRMVIRTDLSSVTLADGQPASVDWRGPATQTVHAPIQQPLSVTAGPSNASLIIDFDAGRSFAALAGGCDSLAACSSTRPTFQFLPWVRAVNEDATGTIVGTVRGPVGLNAALAPVPDANVTVYRGLNALVLAATGRADGDGRFRIHYVSGGGPYVVEALPPVGVPGGYGYARDVFVNAGEESVADVMLGTDAGSGSGDLVISGSTEADVGESIYLTAFVFNEEGDSVFGTAVSWRHSEPGVAQLEGGGATVKLTGLAAGTTWLVAAAGALADSVLVTVGGTGAPVDSVEVSPSSSSLAVSDSTGFQAILRDAAGQVLTNRTVAWSVDDPTVLTIMGTFGHHVIVSAKAPGTATLRAASGGKEGVATVKVQ